MNFCCPSISLFPETTDISEQLAIHGRWLLMWALAGSIFFAAKLVMMNAAGSPHGWRRFAFLFLWPGLDVKPWLGRSKRSSRTTLRWFSGLPALGIGLGLIHASGWIAGRPFVSTWVGMLGLILCLHFGSFRWLAFAWQRVGIPVRPIMEEPLLSRSLSEFWGVRWNRGFRDFAQTCIGLPVARCAGRTAALWSVFVFSGLVHEAVISVPAGGGYGLPLGYFILQAAGIAAEKHFAIRGYLWVLALTGPSALLLFHPPFVERVMAPFIATLRQFVP